MNLEFHGRFGHVGMTLDEDLVGPSAIRLVPAWHEVTRSLIVRLTSIAGGVV